MTSIHVRRTSVILAVLFVGAAAAWGALARTPAAPPPVETRPVVAEPPAGAAAFQSRCVTCHDEASFVDSLRRAPDHRAALDAMRVKLASGHGDADAAEVRAILSYLAERAGGS